MVILNGSEISCYLTLLLDFLTHLLEAHPEYPFMQSSGFTHFILTVSIYCYFEEVTRPVTHQAVKWLCHISIYSMCQKYLELKWLIGFKQKRQLQLLSGEDLLLFCVLCDEKWICLDFWTEHHKRFDILSAVPWIILSIIKITVATLEIKHFHNEGTEITGVLYLLSLKSGVERLFWRTSWQIEGMGQSSTKSLHQTPNPTCAESVMAAVTGQKQSCRNHMNGIQLDEQGEEGNAG